jgi:hypothetical protein
MILDSARIETWKDGGLEGQIRAYRADLAKIVARAKSSFPNLQLVYVMPFHYAGFAGIGNATREPYAYQEQFGIRRLILSQVTGRPVLVWGPYVFSNTMDPSYYYDGIHFSGRGRQAMATLSWQFFQNNSSINRWLS